MTRQRLVSPAAALVLLLALAVAVETVAARKLTQGDQPAEELQPVVDNEDPFDDRYAMAEDEVGGRLQEKASVLSGSPHTLGQYCHQDATRVVAVH